MDVTINLSNTSLTQSNCTLLQIVDTTGLTSSPGDNSGKWGDKVFRGDITSATIQIVLPNGSDLFSTPYDVTSQINGSTDDNVYFTPFSPSGTKFVDGLYTITYSVTVYESHVSSTYSNTICIAVTCNASCCVDSLWSQLPAKMCNKCDYMDYLNLCLEAEAYLNALCASSCCGNTTSFNKIQAMLDKICNINSNCNCN